MNTESSVAPKESISEKVSEQTGKTIDLLFSLFLDVIRQRQPEIEPVLLAEATVPVSNRSLLMRSLQAEGIWFQLLNIAEEISGMSRRRAFESELGPSHVDHSFADVINRIRERGTPAEEIQAFFDQANIRPVLTAHPTEAKRVTVLEIHRRLYLLLMELESPRWTERERSHLTLKVRNEIDLLWLTGELRLEKPSVNQEVIWGLHFFRESLFERLPELIDKLEWALELHYPGESFSLPPFFQFGSWIGGDRDGNPFVTNNVTRETLFTHRRVCLERYHDQLEELRNQLSIGRHTFDVDESFRAHLSGMIEQAGHESSITERNPGEVFRQYTVLMLHKLSSTLDAARQNALTAPDAFAYTDADELIRDLQFLEDTLCRCDCESIARQLVRPFRREVEAFRFKTVSLDIRQNTTVTTNTLQAIWEQRNAGNPCPPKDSNEWKNWLLAEICETGIGPVSIPNLEGAALETVELMNLIRETRSSMDRSAFGNFVLSMTQSVEDILGVYLLARYAGLFSESSAGIFCTLPIVPLFETIEDLQAASAIMQELFSIPVVRQSIDQAGGVQEVMIGYSDSNKDGGYLSSNWELNVAQTQLTAIGQKCGIPISFFHGRGGSISRGGAPIEQAIAAQPPGSVHGQMRITEQGEVVSSKFANRGTAQYHMELLAASVMGHSLLTSADSEQHISAELNTAFKTLSESSFSAYRELVEQPGLLDYYSAASPVEELSLLNIGSRPARRFGAQSLGDLRAIPWVFAWTQNRHLVPSWYGLGSALETFKRDHDPDGKLLKELFDESALFHLVIDEAEKTLAQVDLSIAKAYAELVTDTAIRDAIFTLIEAEYHRTVDRVLEVSASPTLIARFPRVRRKLARRLPTINQIGLEQVRLIRHFRALPEDDSDRRKALVPLLMSINCIATGLGWTG